MACDFTKGLRQVCQLQLLMEELVDLSPVFFESKGVERRRLQLPDRGHRLEFGLKWFRCSHVVDLHLYCRFNFHVSNSLSNCYCRSLRLRRSNSPRPLGRETKRIPRPMHTIHQSLSIASSG